MILKLIPNIKKKKIPAGVRKTCWDTYNGKKFESPCYCCKRNKVTAMDFHAGHIIAEVNGGDISITNLRPVCSRCNGDMGSENMADFAKRVYHINSLEIDSEETLSIL